MRGWLIAGMILAAGAGAEEPDRQVRLSSGRLGYRIRRSYALPDDRTAVEKPVARKGTLEKRLFFFFDVDGNGKLNWGEAEKYRLGVQKRVLAQFDKDKDGKLTGDEREAAKAWLAKGLPAPRRRWNADDWRRRYDLQRYDKNKDGKLDADEIAARDAEKRKWADQRRAYMAKYEARTKKHDADSTGSSSEPPTPILSWPHIFFPVAFTRSVAKSTKRSSITD